ncbi:GumC family protein [Bacteroidota bacterium]
MLTIFIGLSIAYYINRYAEEVFTVTASVIISDNQSAGSIDNIFTEYLGRYRRRAVVENEISVLKSYRLARQTIDELDEFRITYMGYGRIRERLLYKNAPFVVEIDTSEYNLLNYPVFISDVKGNRFRLEINEHHEIDTILQFGQKYKTDIFSFTINKRYEKSDFSYAKYSFKINKFNSLANSYLNKLSIEVNDERGSILNLSISGPIPQQATDYLNKLNEMYIQYGLDEKNKTSELSIEFIEDQLQGIKDSVKKAEIRLQNFRIQNQIFDLSREGQLIFTKLDKYESEKSMVSMQGNYFDYLFEYLEKTKNNTEIIAPSILGIQDQLLNRLVQEYNTVFSQKKVLEYSANPDNPGVEIFDIELNNIKKVLYENVNNLIENNKLTLSNLNQQIKTIEKEINTLPLIESKLLTFEREFNINNDVYTYLLEKKAEAGITKASNVPDNIILDDAQPDNAQQIAPKKKMNYFMGGFIGALLPLIIIILIDFFNNKIIEKREIEEKTRIPILGSIGHNEW